jgi:hypothetical protein
MHGKGGHDFPSEPGELSDWFARRHHGAYGYVGWQAQKFKDHNPYNDFGVYAVVRFDTFWLDT